jgi:hypothetical protein
MYAMIEFVGAIGLVLTGYMMMRGLAGMSQQAPQAVPVRVMSRRDTRPRP